MILRASARSPVPRGENGSVDCSSTTYSAACAASAMSRSISLAQRRRPAFFAAQRASPPPIHREDCAGRKVRAHHVVDADDVVLSFPEDAIGIRLRDVSRHPDLPRRDSPKPGDCDAVTRPLHHLDRYGPAGRQPRGAHHTRERKGFGLARNMGRSSW